MRHYKIVLCIFLIFSFSVCWAEQPKNLTRNGKIVRHTFAARSYLERLHDGDRNQVFRSSLYDTLPVSIVFGFSGQEITPMQFHLYLPEAERLSRPTRIEILASASSPSVGFFSLGRYKISSQGSRHIFPIPPTPVRYVMIRVLNSTDQRSFHINELEILGILGRQKSKYSFLFSPVSSEILLDRIKADPTLRIEFHPLERELFRDAADGRLTRFSFSNAALIASGVISQLSREVYLSKIEGILKRLKPYLRRNRDYFQRAKLIFLFLHRYYFKRYNLYATDLHVTLNRGEYNCVSSSILYNIVGRIAGLDLRGIEVPDHTFSILYKGLQHIDIETTTPVGFDSENSREAALVVQRQTGFVYIPTRNRAKRREVSVIGQIALIYYNRGVILARQKRFDESTRNYVKALMLDKNLTSAIKNMIANFGNHGNQLSRQGYFREGIRKIQIALKIAPQDKTLRNNLIAVYHNWALHYIKRHHYRSAIQILQKAHRNFPEETVFLSDIAEVYYANAKRHYDREELTEALEILNQGIRENDHPKIRKFLENARSSLFFSAAQEKIKTGNWEKAIEIFEQGLSVEPRNQNLRIARNVVYFKWAQEMERTVSLKAAARIYKKAMVKDPTEWRFAHNLKAIYHRRTRKYLEQKDFEKALMTLKELDSVSPSEKSTKNNILYIYQQWSRSLLQGEKIKSAYRAYKISYSQFPKYKEIRTMFFKMFSNNSIEMDSKAKLFFWSRCFILFTKRIPL